MAPGLGAAAVNESLLNRTAVLAGLAMAAVVAAWWLGATRLALDQGMDAADSASAALQALLLARGMSLAVLGVRTGARREWRPAAAASLGLIVPAWPVILLAWSASTVPVTPIVLTEVLLLAGCCGLPMIGRRLRRWLRSADLAVAAGTVTGVALAAGIWLTHAFSIAPLH